MATPSGKIVSSVLRSGLFKNKVAIVTGGATGIGKCIAEELLFLGCNVMIASRKAERLQKTVEEIRTWSKETRNNAKIDWMVCSIRQEEQVQNLISSTIQKFGKLDFLINNGGGQFLCPAEDIRLKGWNAVIDTNLTGTFLMCKEAFNQWMRDNGGSIVNIIADMWLGIPMMSHTAAARAGVENLTKSLSMEWVQHGVRINSVAPGSSIYSETAAANYGDANIFERTKSSVPYKRLGTVEEISGVVCFLLSPAASFITGETLTVDAGQHLYTNPTAQIPHHQSIPAYTWENDVKVRAKQQEDTEEVDPKSKL